LPQLPQRISPGLYPPITNLARQCGHVTEYPPDLRFMCPLHWLYGPTWNLGEASPESLVSTDHCMAYSRTLTLASERKSPDRR
jgi:hypothetical protein